MERRRMRFILVPMGSAGDVHPLVWMARLLRARGHEVSMVVQAVVAEMAERAGIRHVAVGDKSEQESVVRNPDIWDPKRAFDLIAHYMPIYAREMYGALEAEVAGCTEMPVMIGGTIAYAARILADRRNVPLLTVHLQPMTLMSAVDLPVMLAGCEWMRGLPLWARRAFMNIGNWKVDKVLGRPLAALRREMGETGASAKNIMREWGHSPDGILCTFPEWYARKAPDWPAQAHVTRFPLYDEGAVMEEDPELEAFLRAGPPPVVITPGSANALAARFLREGAEACKRAGLRGLLVTRFPEQVPGGVGGAGGLPETIRFFKYVPFGRIFPRAGAVVHHGGIGTTAQCLAAGVPQLVMPMAHDQPDNAARVKAMGVGENVYPKKFTAERVAEVLRELMGSEGVRAACARRREMVAGQMTEGEMGELIEGLSERAIVRRAGSKGARHQEETGG
ncbi:MAG TPA: glycosyltransferase [Phycisphaerae bacterium]|nr:glycosyltransferase [Phycisphaerae bacterium]